MSLERILTQGCSRKQLVSRKGLPLLPFPSLPLAHPVPYTSRLRSRAPRLVTGLAEAGATSGSTNFPQPLPCRLAPALRWRGWPRHSSCALEQGFHLRTTQTVQQPVPLPLCFKRCPCILRKMQPLVLSEKYLLLCHSAVRVRTYSSRL